MAKKQAEEINKITYDDASRYMTLDGKIKELSKERDESKDKFKTFVSKSGEENPDGSRIVNVSSPGQATITFKVAKRYNTKLVDDAIDIITQKCSRKQRRHLIETIEIVRVDRLEEMIKAGEITTELAEELLQVSETGVFTTAYSK